MTHKPSAANSPMASERLPGARAYPSTSSTQGLGGAFLEHLVYDASGQLLTGSLADYLIPTATDFPKIRAIALENHPSPSNPLGVKGAGEGAIIPIGGVMAEAVANAWPGDWRHGPTRQVTRSPVRSG